MSSIEKSFKAANHIALHRVLKLPITPYRVSNYRGMPIWQESTILKKYPCQHDLSDTLNIFTQKLHYNRKSINFRNMQAFKIASSTNKVNEHRNTDLCLIRSDRLHFNGESTKLRAKSRQYKIGQCTLSARQSPNPYNTRISLNIQRAPLIITFRKSYKRSNSMITTPKKLVPHEIANIPLIKMKPPKIIIRKSVVYNI